MISRRNRAGLGFALSAALSCFGFTRSLRAQDASGDPLAGDSAPKTDDTTKTEPATSDAPSSDASAKEAPKEEPKAEEAKAAAPPPEPAAEPAKKEESSLPVSVERVPGSGYPAPRVRGITGGSLWMTMHGLQWPYLPAVGEAGSLRLGFSGSVWSDGSYARIKSGSIGAGGLPNPPHQKRLANQSRGVLRVSPTYSMPSGWFAQGQAEFVALGDQQLNTSVGVMGFTDDLWVRVGKWNVFDVTAGRFQGWEIANHYGMGLDLNTLEREGADIPAGDYSPKDAYGLTYFWDRTDVNLGAYAVHVYPTDFVRVELLTQLGAGKTTFPAIQTNFRPSAILDLGFLKVKGGFEWGKAVPQADEAKGEWKRNGYGFALQGVFNPWVDGGVAYSRGFEDIIDPATELRDPNKSNTVTGISGFINARAYKDLLVGGGVLYSHWVNMTTDLRPNSPHYGEHDYDQQFQTYGAIQYGLWDTFYVKFVGAYAHWRHQDRSSTPFANTLLSGRLRLLVNF